MSDYRGYVTNDGFAFEATAAELQIPVVIAKILIGDGKLPDGESPADQKQMINKIREFPAVVFKDKKNPGQFIARCTIPASDSINGQGYYIREMGCELGGQGQGILYAYRRVSDDFKPVVSSGEIKSYMYQLRFIPSNASNIDVTVDANGVYVTEEELEAHRSSPDHPMATMETPGFVRMASPEDMASGSQESAATPGQVISAISDASTGITSIAALRKREPIRPGERVEVISYYDDWAVTLGEPEFGGDFWHDKGDKASVDDGFKVIVTAGGNRWKRVKGVYSPGHAGARSDEYTTDSTTAIQTAINKTPSGGTLIIDQKLLASELVYSKPIRILGNNGGTLCLNAASIKTSNFRASRIEFKCRAYDQQARPFKIRAYEDLKDYEDIDFEFCFFNGFFYSTDLRGREYYAAKDNPANRVVKRVSLYRCVSVAPKGVSAGHFQHTGITDVTVIGCSSYGGAGATSYNFINCNGLLKVIGNYDENNTYGSLELENSSISNSVISGNVFGSDLWIDDTSNVAVTGNVVMGKLRVTSQTDDVHNVSLVGNIAAVIRVERFGENPSGLVYGANISDNTTTGTESGSQDIFLGALVTGKVTNNLFNGKGEGNSLGIVRRSSTDVLICGNKSPAGRPMASSGSGGRVIEYQNDGMGVLTDADSVHISRMLVPNKDYMDLPGTYKHPTRYSGVMSASGGTKSIVLPIPDTAGSVSFGYRGLSFRVMIWNTTTGELSSFRVDGFHKVPTLSQIGAQLGSRYAKDGTDEALLEMTLSSSSTQSVQINLKNNAAHPLQVTVLPETTSRLGTEQ